MTRRELDRVKRNRKEVGNTAHDTRRHEAAEEEVRALLQDRQPRKELDDDDEDE